MSGLDSCPKWNNVAGHVCGSSDVPGGLSPLFNGLSPTLLTISDAFPGIISQLNSAHSTSLPLLRSPGLWAQGKVGSCYSLSTRCVLDPKFSTHIDPDNDRSRQYSPHFTGDTVRHNHTKERPEVPTLTHPLTRKHPLLLH